MVYKTLKECVTDLEKNGHLIRIKEEVDPNLEIAAIHLRVFEAGGPALLFENIKGTEFPAVSNLFGSLERSRFIFRGTLEKVKRLVELKRNPLKAFKNPLKYISILNALPKKLYGKSDIFFAQTQIERLPQIKCWQNDGGAYILLPQVYTEDIDNPGVMKSNLGCYRIQISGNEYKKNEEIGLHYQLHRGIGIHQSKANSQGKPLKVSIFVGGPPAHTVASVMPLPEGLSELTFAGALGGRRFRYAKNENYVISTDADFVITGEVYPGENKPEGPFGDHLGYYSMKHEFPVMRVHKVFHRKDAIYPFTVVGRPPQEDTQFGALIHEITGPVIPDEIPGLHEVYAVDGAGVHPLLLALGSERYTPYLKERKPQELLTIANHILGFGQMSLAKYLIIAAKEDNSNLKTCKVEEFLIHVLERADWKNDLHFHTNTTIDTLDYSGTGLNSGSKVVIAAAGDKKYELCRELPPDTLPPEFGERAIVFPGVLAVSSPCYKDEASSLSYIENLANQNALQNIHEKGIRLIILCDDCRFVADKLNNFLWVTFTKSNPSHDIHGVNSSINYKHWSCKGALIIDARIKLHHSPILEKDPVIEKKVDRLGKEGGSLHGII